MKLFGLVLLFPSLMCFSCFGQGTTVAVSSASQKPVVFVKSAADYSNEPLVVERWDTVYRMQADGTGSRTMTLAVKIQTESALKGSGVVQIGFAGNSERVELGYVRVRRPDGTVVTTEVGDAIEMPMPVTQAAPFYSDLKQMQVPVRSLRLGDTLEWQAKVVRTKAEAAGEFWGQDSFVQDSVTLAETLELRVPKDRAVTVWSKTGKAAETVEGEERVYRWTSSQTKATTGKEAEAAKEAAKKKVWTAEQERDAKEGKLPDVAWTTFKSWEAVGAWYRGLEEARMAPDAAVKAKVAEVTAGKTTEEAKVEAVYGYVATQIRYIGVAFGVGRYQPHGAGTVLENQYGDCKDKHTLLAAMLGALGVRADAVLIGAGLRFNEAVPSPGAFNHLITSIEVGGRPVWLDTTAEVAPYGMLLSVIRDRQGLAVPETGVARLERTPADAPFKPFQKMEAVGALDETGTSNSRLVLTLRGDDEITVRAALRSVAPAQYGEMVQRMSQGMGYAGTTSNPEIGKLEDTTVPLTIAYEYKREKSGDWDNLRILPQLPPVVVPDANEKDPPVQTLTLGAQRVETSTSEMKLPEGWSAELPETVHAHSAFVNLDETYRLEKGALFTERKIEVLRETVPVAEWKEYAKWVKASGLEDGERFVQLTRPGMQKATLEKSSGEEMLRAAYAMIERRQLDAAERTLAMAKNANPDQTGLWSDYGLLALQRHDLAGARKDFAKELELHPDAYVAYGALAQVEALMGQKHEAEASLRKWSELAKDDPKPVAALARMLTDDGDPAGAVTAAKEGLDRMAKQSDPPEQTAPLRLMLGKAQLASGKKDEGRETLVALLKETEDAGIKNDTAYELGDAGLELSLAESSARAALTQMEADSKSWALDETPQGLMSKTRLIEATWDTVGWILYREGKTEEAANYVRASWANRQSAEVGRHLGEIEGALGNKAASQKAYELAKAASGTVSPEEAMKSMKAAGGGTAQQAGAARLQEMRKIPLGPARGLNGTAEYLLLLGNGGLEVVKPVGETRMPPGVERLTGLKMAGYWPKGSEAKLVRNGLLNCHSGICELVMEP